MVRLALWDAAPKEMNEKHRTQLTDWGCLHLRREEAGAELTWQAKGNFKLGARSEDRKFVKERGRRELRTAKRGAHAFMNRPGRRGVGGWRQRMEAGHRMYLGKRVVAKGNPSELVCWICGFSECD